MWYFLEGLPFGGHNELSDPSRQLFGTAFSRSLLTARSIMPATPKSFMSGIIWGLTPADCLLIGHRLFKDSVASASVWGIVYMWTIQSLCCELSCVRFSDILTVPVLNLILDLCFLNSVLLDHSIWITVWFWAEVIYSAQNFLQNRSTKLTCAILLPLHLFSRGHLGRSKMI